MIEKLKNIWMTWVESSYLEGRITTERGLQSNLYAHILREEPDWKVYVEPGFYPPDGMTAQYKPDLVICDSRNILAIIEIKFVPHHYPQYISDLDKMIDISSNVNYREIFLDINQKTGKDAGNKHVITRETNFVFMVIGQDDAAACDPKCITDYLSRKALENPFWLFYGKIKPDNAPVFGVEQIGS